MLGGRSQAAGRGPWGLRRDLGKVLGKGPGGGVSLRGGQVSVKGDWERFLGRLRCMGRMGKVPGVFGEGLFLYGGPSPRKTKQEHLWGRFGGEGPSLIIRPSPNPSAASKPTVWSPPTFSAAAPSPPPTPEPSLLSLGVRPASPGWRRAFPKTESGTK